MGFDHESDRMNLPTNDSEGIAKFLDNIVNTWETKSIDAVLFCRIIDSERLHMNALPLDRRVQPLDPNFIDRIKLHRSFWHRRSLRDHYMLRHETQVQFCMQTIRGLAARTFRLYRFMQWYKMQPNTKGTNASYTSPALNNFWTSELFDPMIVQLHRDILEFLPKLRVLEFILDVES